MFYGVFPENLDIIHFRYSLIFAFFLVMTLKQLYEGTRLTCFLYIVTEAICIILLVVGDNSFLGNICFFLQFALQSLSIHFLQFNFQYIMPEPTGQFKVGLRQFKLADHFNSDVSVFYPTRAATGVNCKYLQYAEYWEKIS